MCSRMVASMLPCENGMKNFNTLAVLLRKKTLLAAEKYSPGVYSLIQAVQLLSEQRVLYEAMQFVLYSITSLKCWQFLTYNVSFHPPVSGTEGKDSCPLLSFNPNKLKWVT